MFDLYRNDAEEDAEKVSIEPDKRKRVPEEDKEMKNFENPPAKYPALRFQRDHGEADEDAYVDLTKKFT